MKNVIVRLGSSVAILVALLIAYAVWYGFVAHETARVASLDQSIATQSDTTARAAQAASELAQLGPQEAAVESHFVGVPDVVSFLQLLQNVGAKEGSTVTVGSVSEAASPRAHLAMALTITGSFDAVMRTMGIIENGPYDIETSQAKLTSTGDGEWDAAMTLSVATRKDSRFLDAVVLQRRERSAERIAGFGEAFGFDRRFVRFGPPTDIMNHLDFSRFVIKLKYGSTLKPQRDWFVLLAIAFILLVVCACVNAYLFIAVENGQALSNEVVPTNTSTSVDTTSIDNAQKIFDARAATAARYAADPHFSDPAR